MTTNLTLRKLILLSAAIVAFSPAAKAQLNSLTNTIVYTTDFNGAGYTSDAPAKGQAGWYTTSGNSPGPGAIRALNYNAGSGPQVNSLVLGGNTYGSVLPSVPSTMPDTQQTTLLHVAETGQNNVFIRSTFDIYYASGIRDTFGYSFVSSSGRNLFDILFVPTVLPNNATVYKLGIQSYANYGNEFAPIQYLTSQAGQQLLVNPNTWTDAGYYISGIGTTNQSISLYTYQASSTNYYGTTLIDYSDFSLSPYNDGNTNVGSLGITWFIQDGNSTNSSGNLTNYGNNTMIVQNLTVSIPEPKAWVLMGISSLIMVVALRRKRA